MIKPETLSQICQRAIALIEEKGWRQGVRLDSQTRLCAGEALKKARTELDLPVGLGEVFDAVMADGDCPITLWNDRRGRTKEEVIERLQSKVLPNEESSRSPSD